MKLGKVFIFALALTILGACSQGSAIEIGNKAPDFFINGN